MEKKIPKRSEDYSAWYNSVIEVAQLAEHAPVRGCMTIKPHGYAIWERIQAVLDKMFKDRGVENAYFPIFIPDELLSREAEHIEGFSPELAMVTHAGGKELERPLAVRPTSETIMYEAYSRWIQSYRDLPLLINQWANVVRWEKKPRLFLRTSEFLWQEGHTVHETAEEARDYALMILLEVYKEFAQEYLAMPVYTGRKSQREKFAGAQDTYCIEALMQDGKSLQAGTAHDLGDNFSRSFDVSFLGRDGEISYAFQSCWGVSTRLIGGLIMSHGDDRGIILPPKISPLQIVVVPIDKGARGEVWERAWKIKDSLSSLGHSVKVDDREKLRPGEKYYEWERKGIPLRIEIGPRDLEKNSCVLVRRDEDFKEDCSLFHLQERVSALLEKIQISLFRKAEKRRRYSNRIVGSWSEFEEAVAQGGYIFAPWCERQECEAEIKEKTKATTRCHPFKDIVEDEWRNQICIHCGKKAPSENMWIFARSY